MTECYFAPKKETTSATICANCGVEKMLHTIGEGIKVNKIEEQINRGWTVLKEAK